MSEWSLASAVDRLQEAYETARRALAEENARYDVAYAPEEMRDSSGRYILLDALTAIVSARAALETSVRPVEAVAARPGDTLILRLRPDISADLFERFRVVTEADLADRLPGVKLVYVGGVDQLAVFRPDEDVQT
jgi:hypothetical protein